MVCWGQDSVDQPSREKTSAEGNQATLLCNYTLMSAANAYLFWYKQLPNSIGPKEEDMNITSREGESVTLRCSYDTSSNNIYLYWYRQYPNREPEYLLWKGARSYGGEDKTDQRFQPTSSQSSTELTINSVTLSDSALYYCALRHNYSIMMTHWKKYFVLFISYFLGCKSEEAVHQNMRVQTAVEGAAVTINCTFTTTDPSQTLFWYQQKVNGFPKYMLNRVGAYGDNEEEFKKRFNASLNTLTRSVPLMIQDVCVSDSAVYYCALCDDCRQDLAK
ncbi:uncharacterized protein LOC127499100 [Ctenopharyngodon idella]|uniref:uncharacterized protein LOC127499100 n=1 Tax=Ctenopharyngodon idella TaxID=7959 RepID=UPI002232670F|nr:uncharacterized protein LOC127499100 [Ctenopharyngodon idella]